MNLIVIIFFVNYYAMLALGRKVDKQENIKKSPKFSNTKDDVVFPPAPPEYWTADGECADNPTFAEDCKIWAATGFCTKEEHGQKYQNWMRKHCMASCQVCTASSQRLKLALKSFAGVGILLWLTGILQLPRIMSNRKCAKLILSTGLATCLYFI
uniref:ShKT domain-containing protein n=1 Tax=Ciona savignyi TaxID=51511 RepID=H2YL53_CIOSA